MSKEGRRKDFDIPNKHVKMDEWGIRLRLREENGIELRRGRKETYN